jgi:cysteinyl-tRNA synthetase
MSMKFLGDHLDIHCGGTDHIDVHHTNEIAQSEAATGRKFFNFWLHGAFLNIQGGKKMAKSAENFLTLENSFARRGMSPIVYRFAAFLSHYRKPMEYSDEAVEAARNGLAHLQNQIRSLKEKKQDKGNVHTGYKERFLQAINDDLNLPRAMAAVQEVLKADISAADRLATVMDFNRVLGLNLDQVEQEEKLPEDLQKLVDKRQKAREEKDWALSDSLRDEIQALGYVVQDSKSGMKVYKP